MATQLQTTEGPPTMDKTQASHRRSTTIRRMIATMMTMLLMAASTVLVAPASASTPVNPWSQAGWEDASALADYNPKDYAGSMYWVTRENVYALVLPRHWRMTR